MRLLSAIPSPSCRLAGSLLPNRPPSTQRSTRETAARRYPSGRALAVPAPGNGVALLPARRGRHAHDRAGNDVGRLSQPARRAVAVPARAGYDRRARPDVARVAIATTLAGDRAGAAADVGRPARGRA